MTLRKLPIAMKTLPANTASTASRPLRAENAASSAMPSHGVPSRRNFLLSLAGLAAAAGMPACRRSEESITAYVTQPEGLMPGVARHYSTTITQLDSAFGVTVESHDAHPTKIEGNPKHPESLGATTAQLQATLFDLYDVDRSHGPAERGISRTWAEAERMLDELRTRLLKNGGAELGVVIGAHRSLTLRDQLGSLRKSFPRARIVHYAPLDPVEARAATNLVYGRTLETLVHWGAVERALLLDADPFGLEGSPIAAANAWANRRCSESTVPNRLYAVESSLSLTGSVADHRWSCESHRIVWVLARLATMLVERGTVSLPRDVAEQLLQLGTRLTDATWTRRLNLLADEFGEHRGHGLILAGARQPTAVHSLIHVLNYSLGNVGTTHSFSEAFVDSSESELALRQLSTDVSAGTVKTLVLIDCNPVFTAPGDVDVASAMGRAELCIHLGSFCDETAKLCDWHLNLAHDLESWSDAVARDGTTSLTQPIILPLWGSKTAAEVVARLAGAPKVAFDLVRSTWRTRFGTSEFESRWRAALIDGVSGEVTPPLQLSAPDTSGLAERIAADCGTEFNDVELVFSADANLHDGRNANNGWLQELPHPITKTTWGNPAWLSRELATRLGIEDGQRIRLKVRDRSIDVPAIIVPGQAAGTITLSVGHGHSRIGRNGDGTGVNVYPLRQTRGRWIVPLDGLIVMSESSQIARTQVQFDQQGRELARERAVTSMRDHLGTRASGTPIRPSASAPSGLPHAWGMAIDLTRCNGCQACVVACQAENNVPFVGRDAIIRGRHMHWLRVDRYFSADATTTKTIAQPLPCQQCEDAPCETVCPVGATAHSQEGLNDMVYNRCVGSRYCANNCPYEVRRFNYLELNANLADVEKLRMNPDVSVRSRGVMEKCTFCVQRIQRARIGAKKLGFTRIRDGAIVPACAQACPTKAIAFGDLADPASNVHHQSRSPHAYRLLEELHTKPRVYYLTRLRNPHPNV